MQLKKNPNRPTKSLNTYSEGTNIQLFKSGRLAECVEQCMAVLLNQFPAAYPCSRCLPVPHHTAFPPSPLAPCTRTNHNLCWEVPISLRVEQNQNLSKRGYFISLYDYRIRYHNRYPHISKNKRHTNVHVYIVIKALVLFFLGWGHTLHLSSL